MNKIFIALLFSALTFAEVLKVGTSPGYPPFEFMANNKIVGFDIDLVKAAAKKLNLQVEFVPIEFDGLIAALKAKKINIIASGMNYTPARAKNVQFSKPYYQSKNWYLKLASNDKLNSYEDLAKGATLGAQIGTLQADEIAKIQGVKSYLNADHLVFIMATLTGKIDGFILDAVVAQNYMRKYPNKFSVFAKTQIPTKGLCLAFNKDSKALSEQFDKAINELKSDGIYQQLLQKYNID